MVILYGMHEHLANDSFLKGKVNVVIQDRWLVPAFDF